jgi:hypothetical protein
MKGLTTISPGFDLAEPTFPDWEAYAERKYGPDSRLGKIWAQLVEREMQRQGLEENHGSDRGSAGSPDQAR